MVDILNEKIPIDLFLHCSRVAEISALIAVEMGLGVDECVDVVKPASVHDIGKIHIPEAILYKPGALTREEYLEMQQHTVYSSNIVSQIDYLKKYARIVMLHHEHYDGSGYFGVKGEHIPLPSRIITIADCFDAMTNDRPYRKAYTIEAAVKEMVKEARYKYDPRIFEVFLKIIGEGLKKNTA